MKRSLPFIMLLLNCVIIFMITAAHAYATSIVAVMSSDQPRYREAHRAFVKAITSHGFTTQNTSITLITASLDNNSLTTEIRKIGNSHPDLILAYGANASLVALRETAGLPVVSVDVFAPAQPLKGQCGVSSRVSIVTLVNTLQSIRPFQRLGVLYSPREAGSLQQLEDLKIHATKSGISMIEGSVTSSVLLESELNKLLDKCDALLITEGGLFSQQFERIIAKTNSKKIPTASTMPDAAERGAIVSLEINPQEQGYLAAEIANRILEGARSEYLPLIRPQRIDMVINMRRARDIGIEVPFNVSRSATRLIK